MEEDEKKRYYKERSVEKTNEEYRKEIIAIFANMYRNDKLQFWYKYISAIEKGEG